MDALFGLDFQKTTNLYGTDIEYLTKTLIGYNLMETNKPIGMLKVDIVWQGKHSEIKLPYYHPLEIPKCKEKLQRMAIEVLKRWMMESGELTPEELKEWPKNILKIINRSKDKHQGEDI